MLKTVRHTIKRFNMLDPGDGVLVGLSGGADSVALLAALAALRKELGISVFAAHVNHNLRGAAQHDEEFARRICDGMGIPITVFQADVAGYATREKLSTEEAGRKLRYQYMHQALEKFGAVKIATGHHADDNAETILLNLFRGAGLKGLCGIPPVNGNIIRPLLEVSRKDIESYAQENGLPFVIDETNAESEYSRNYVRNKIIPVIQSHFGDGVTAIMAKNALEMRADDEFLSVTASEAYRMLADHSQSPEGLRAGRPAYEGLLVHATGGKPAMAANVSLPINKLLANPPSISSRIIRQAISQLRGVLALEDIQSTHTQAILDIAQGRTGREANLPGITAQREYENLVLQTSSKNAAESFCFPLSPGVPVYVHPNYVTLTLKPPQKKQFCCTQTFNYDKVEGVLELRTRCPGDKITLEGVGTKKLQDYFTDTKTPKSQRDCIPLLADGSNILWVMDKHNRVNAAYKPEYGQNTCWVTVETVES